MKIQSANIQMQSSHAQTEKREVSMQFEAWSAPDNRASLQNLSSRNTPASSVRLSDAALAAQKADASRLISESGDPKLDVLIRMLEFFTGKPVKIANMSELRQPPTESSTASRSVPSQAQTGTAGFRFDYHSSYAESESTSFAANGIVRTADGQEIRFDLAFTMQRQYSEELSFSLQVGQKPPPTPPAQGQLKDPLILDFAGTAAELSDIRFRFDLDADGQLDDVPLTGGSGFLAFDRDGNGRIDDGRELFGAISGDGFADLAALDSDGNGWIDENDPAYALLRIWRPDASGQGELKTLAEANVGAIYLGRANTAFDLKDAANTTQGVMRTSGIYLREDGSVGTISQVDLRV